MVADPEGTSILWSKGDQKRWFAAPLILSSPPLKPP